MLETMIALEAKEKEEEEERERGEEERKKKEAEEETAVRVKAAVNKLVEKLKARKAAKNEEEERQAPPWHTYLKDEEGTKLLSERVLLMRGVTGHSKESLQDILVNAIGEEIPFQVRMVSEDTLACITFRNKLECTESWVKLFNIKNPIRKAASKRLTCIRAKYKEKRVPGQKDWGDIKNRWATPSEMSEGSTRDKCMRVGGEWIHDKDEHTRNVRGQKEEEEEPPVSPPTKEKEEPKPQEYGAYVRADSPVSDETWRCIDVLKTDYPVYWLNLMRHETGFLTNEEALEEAREEGQGKQEEGSHTEKHQERRPRSTARRQEGQDAEDQSRKKRRSRSRTLSRGRRIREMKARSASPKRRIKER